ncbi:hypothetical protein [Butyrivibrio sp. VCB2006]|uniref:hypothetical protein n=1 Tax=Butyrivibrio sp. VCB2006 TaxID=1280679 RepID=UPI00040ECF38|nr:hypothetical protein [Butyrivibrio sp. VCB2006]
MKDNTDLSKEKLNTSSNNSRKYRRLFISFWAILLAAFVLVGGVVVYVDPFFHYHKPIPGFPYVVDNQLSQNPGMARNMNYDSCIIGSSMTVNFDTDDFKELMGLDTLKLSCSGAYPRDDYNMLSIVFDQTSYARKSNPVEAVFFAIDIPVMAADIDTVKYERPEYLYDNNIFNDVKYVLNKDVIMQYIFRPIVQRQGTDLSEAYFSWWTPDYYNIQWVMHTYEEPEKVEEELPADAMLEATKENLEENILPFVEEHPETQFYFFFPPYSILYWHNVIQENSLEATFVQYSYVAYRLLQYGNVHLFYFQNMGEVTDLNNYADYSHYKREINRYMVECFASGEHQVFTSEQMQMELDKMRGIINEFDFEDLFSKDW